MSAPQTEELIGRVREADVDAAVILTSFHQSPLPLALLLRLAGVTRITGASTDHPGSLLDVRLRPGEDLPEDIPEALRALAIARAAGYASDDSALRVTAAGDARALTGHEPYVVLHPGASVEARRAPVGLFAAAARLLSSRGWRVIATGSAEESALTAAVVAGDPRAIDLAGRCDLRTLAGVLRTADAVVVGNTGPAHLAAAVGTPVVSLFSPVVPASRWAPHGVPTALLGDQRAPCRGTRARECPVGGHPCLTSIRPREIADAVERLTNRTEPEGAVA